MAVPEQDMLMEEFSVQVYADGRIEWNGLDAFVSKNAAVRRELSAAISPSLGRGGRTAGRAARSRRRPQRA